VSPVAVALRHIATPDGLPYASADVDEAGRYFVTCPVCGQRCESVDAGSEDAATKGVVASYQAHFSREASNESAAVVRALVVGAAVILSVWDGEAFREVSGTIEAIDPSPDVPDDPTEAVVILAEDSDSAYFAHQVVEVRAR
jgi:hypothetical protein